MSFLEIRNVNKYYHMAGNKSFQALKNINVKFERGEMVSIIGESGSGKSTLMNIIGGLDSDFSGSVLLDGKNIRNFKPEELDEYRKNKIGFVFQSCNLISHLTVLDNVTMALRLSNIGKDERRKRAVNALKEVGLIKHLTKKPNELSGGQRQRVAIARALINNPEIIVADEPTGALDRETTENILEIIKKISKKGKLVILVTHSEIVASYSNRVVKLEDGKCIDEIENSKAISLNYNHNKEKQNGNLSFISAVKISEKNIKEKIGRNVLMLFGVSIGIMSIILMLGLGNGLKKYFSSIIYEYMNPVIVEVNMKADDDPTEMVMSVMGGGKTFDENDIKLLSSIKNVIGAERGFSILSIGSSTLEFEGEESMLLMVNSMSKSVMEENIIEGRRPGKNEILISEKVVDDLYLEDFEDILDKEVYVELILGTSLVSSNFTVSGIYYCEGGAPPDETAMIYLNYDDLREIASEYDYDLEPTKVFLEAKNESEAADIKQVVKDLGYSGAAQEIVGEKLLVMLQLMTYVLAGIAAISLVVSAIMIIVVLRISVGERTKEIGLLRAIGARSMDIRRIFVAESFLIGIGSGAVGITLSILLALIINPIVYEFFYTDILSIKFSYLLLGVLVSTFVCVAAGYIPADKAAKLDPVESLRTE